MQLTVLAALCAGLLLAAPASAASCSLVIGGGALALSADGTRLGSEEPGGLAAVVSVASLGLATVTVSAPTLVASPPRFNSPGAVVEVAYRAVALGTVNQGYIAGQTQVDMVGAGLLTINNRVTSATGFAAGPYQTRTVVTCS